MAPTEETIFKTFLLSPASLPTIISLQAFTALFPRLEQSSPEIKRLYRILQHRRALLTDAVAQDIDLEVKRGNAQRRAVVRARRAAETEERDEEIVIENALFGATSNLPISELQTLRSILTEIENASGEVTSEISALESEAEILLADIRSTVSELSDLRYGRLGNSELSGEVLRSLEALGSTCKKR